MSEKLGEYMTVTEIPWSDDRHSTKIWQVHDRHGGILGEVRWNGGWRQYVFEPAPVPTTFSAGCMDDLANFIRLEMAERAADRAYERSQNAR